MQCLCENELWGACHIPFVWQGNFDIVCYVFGVHRMFAASVVATRGIGGCHIKIRSLHTTSILCQFVPDRFALVLSFHRTKVVL